MKINWIICGYTKEDPTRMYWSSDYGWTEHWPDADQYPGEKISLNENFLPFGMDYYQILSVTDNQEEI